MLTYSELAPWYRLLDPLDDHEEDAAGAFTYLRDAVGGPIKRWLELGCGAGNVAHFLPRHAREPDFELVLTDVSAEMLELSRSINPDAEHVVGDMRTLRLDQTFDAVFVGDAVVYMTSEQDLRAAAATAFCHLRDGGAALFAPDCLKHSFVEQTEYSSESVVDDEGRQMRCTMWTRDPDPTDDVYCVDFGYLLLDSDGTVKAYHDSHVEGLFTLETWVTVLASVGFDVEVVTRDVGEYIGYCEEMFLCRRRER